MCTDVDQEIAEFIAERDGHPARADRIYLTNGASEGKHEVPILGFRSCLTRRLLDILIFSR